MTENQDQTTDKKRRIGKPKLLTFAVMMIAVVGAFNSYQIMAATSNTSTFKVFGGASLLSISASYNVGSAPSFGVASQGETVKFNLTITSALKNTHNIAISYNSTLPNDWTANLSCTAATYPGGAVVQNYLTMTIGSTTYVTPSNYAPVAQPPCDQGGLRNLAPNAIITIGPGVTVISGHIDIAINTPDDLSDVLFWSAAIV